MYNKILIYQYGKVGSSSILKSFDSFAGNGQSLNNLNLRNNKYCIQSHSHEVAKDILKNFKNILIINIVRFPVERNLSAFWQNYERFCPNYKELSINEINKCFINSSENIKENNNWMNKLFNVLDINIDNFQFDFEKKFVEIKKNTNTYLFFRYEDYEFISKNILPKHNIIINKNYNVGSEKNYSDYYKKHKEFYKVTQEEEKNIKNSKFLNKFYSKNEINELLKKWK